MTLIVQTIQWRHGTAAQWTAANPVLLTGEPGYEDDTGKYKIGDGTTAWTALAYQAATGSTGPQGPQGDPGPAGANGAPGPQGPAIRGATFAFNLPIDGDTTTPAIVTAAGTITGYSLLAVDAGGAVSIDLWRGASGAVPTVADSILSAPLSTATFTSGDASGFSSAAIAIGDVLVANAAAAQGATSIVLVLTVSQ